MFRVTVNTDNRLMSGVSLSSEFHALTEAFGYGWGDIEWLTINAMKSAFAPFDERLKIINTMIKPGFAAVRPVKGEVETGGEGGSGEGRGGRWGAVGGVRGAGNTA
jgi:adenosine deaminase